MKKLYMIGEKNGQKFVAHETQLDTLDNAMEITKNEYRRHRVAGIPSWGEYKTEAAKSASRNPKRATRWRMRSEKARLDDQRMEEERVHNWKMRQYIAALKK